MNYQNHYNLLMERARNRILECYTEKHHIIPECIGGLDTQENIVSLTPEEHYIAHQLLVKIYPNNRKLLHAAVMMGNTRSTNKLYGWLKKLQSEEMKKNNPSKRLETRLKMAATKRNNWANVDYRKMMSDSHLGQKAWNDGITGYFSEKTLLNNKMKHTGANNSCFGKMIISDGTNEKRILPNCKIPDGWYRGRSVRAKRR